MVFQAQLCESSTYALSLPETNRVLNLFPLHIPPELGGWIEPNMIPDALVELESQDDPELREKILSGQVPTVDTIFR